MIHHYSFLLQETSKYIKTIANSGIITKNPIIDQLAAAHRCGKSARKLISKKSKSLLTHAYPKTGFDFKNKAKIDMLLSKKQGNVQFVDTYINDNFKKGGIKFT